jgi:hypothetical protein
MDQKLEDQHVTTLYHSDDSEGSDSSDQDTDTNSDANINNSNYNSANAEVLDAFKGDNRGVVLWKFVVKIIMISVAILLTAMAYVQLSQSEENDFESSVCAVVRKSLGCEFLAMFSLVNFAAH